MINVCSASFFALITKDNNRFQTIKYIGAHIYDFSLSEDHSIYLLHCNCPILINQGNEIY